MTKVAAIQLCSSQNVKDNLANAQRLIRESAQQGAKLIVLPEMFAIMGMDLHDLKNAQEPLGSGLIQSFLANEARSNQVWLVGGTIPIQGKNKVRAACLVYNDKGECVGHYDKIHLFDVSLSATEQYKESERIEPGEKTTVIDTPFGKLGLAVCYDVRFPELFRKLFNAGAEIITIPAAFTVKTGEAHWEVLTRARAIENFCYVIGACQGGTHENGRQTYGHSLIIEPWGNIAAEIDGTHPGIIYADIDLKKLHAIRQSIPVHLHQRLK